MAFIVFLTCRAMIGGTGYTWPVAFKSSRLCYTQSPVTPVSRIEANFARNLDCAEEDSQPYVTGII